jgi:hypothetical protein
MFKVDEASGAVEFLHTNMLTGQKE